MKRRFLIATHSILAEGFAKTLKFFAGDDIDVTYINAYVDGKPIDEKIDTYFRNFFNYLCNHFAYCTGKNIQHCTQ